MKPALGFIGLGVMGRPMAQHLLRAGYEVTVWARRRESAAPVLELGAQWADSPCAVAQGVDTLLTNLTASLDVEQIALGAEGALHGLRPGSLHVDFSTIAPDTARRIAQAYAAKQADFVDAPVSGGGVGAQNASLSIMWGGKSALAGRLQPLFACLGKTVVHVGAVGAGQVAKLCNQSAMVATIEACAEAARLAAAAGVDFAKVCTALQAGSAASRVLDVFGARMQKRDFAAGVAARLHHKDYAILMDEAAALGAYHPVSAAVWQQLNRLMASGWGGCDTSVLLRVLENLAGGSEPGVESRSV
ncbi:MAG TPA: NAD(P)-dependent oxidoreductase [Rhodocyclaceae bacterium]|nr:NAD(P)-dependent oxidoreductase [Rhodocyclaceae bacterium]